MLLLKDTWFGDRLRRLKWAIPGTFVLGWTLWGRRTAATPPVSLVRPLVVFVETDPFPRVWSINKYNNFNVRLQHFLYNVLKGFTLLIKKLNNLFVYCKIVIINFVHSLKHVLRMFCVVKTAKTQYGLDFYNLWSCRLWFDKWITLIYPYCNKNNCKIGQ